MPIRLAPFAVLALAAACSSSSAPAPASAEPPAFTLKGSRLIGCCCGAPCPCRINKKPMQCHGCDHTDVVRVDEGFIGKTSMAGVTWVVVGRGFGEKTDANWVVVYLDEKATPDQEKALGDMLTADLQRWGPKAKHLAGAFKGMKRVPLEYRVSADRREYAARIPGILDFKARAHVNPGHTEPVVSTGIMDAFGDRFIHADCLDHRYNDAALKYQWDLTGRQANWADFTLTPERVSRGAIGWGCWTAHSDFNDKEKYQEQLVGHEK
jgi:hypothetical protein